MGHEVSNLHTYCEFHLQPLDVFLDEQPTHHHQDVQWAPGVNYRLHYFQFNNQFTVWGLTACILIALSEVVLGRTAGFEVLLPGSRPFHEICWDGSKLGYRHTVTLST